MKRKSEKYGLVLEGGGAKGSYEMGVCKALLELGIKISAVTGTSVGALNGAMVAQKEIDKAYQLWYDIHPALIMNIDEKRLEKLANLEIKPEDMRYYFKMLREVITEGGIDVTPLKKLIFKTVDERKLRKSDIKFGMVTVSFSDRKALELFVEDIPMGQVADYLFASANFPLFRSAKIDEKIYLDGGIYDNLPIRMLVEKGYQSLIVVKVGGLGRKRNVDLKNYHVIHIEPKHPLGGTLNFNTEKARENLKLGYFDTYKVFKGLPGNIYYIDMNIQENDFIQYFDHLDERIIKRVADTLGLKEDFPVRRLLFEKVLPKLANILKIPEDYSYQDIALGLAEKIAIEVGVDRFRIYSFQELIKEIIKKYEKNQKQYSKKENRFIPDFGLLSLFSGDALLKKIIQNLLDEKLMDTFKDRLISNQEGKS